MLDDSKSAGSRQFGRCKLTGDYGPMAKSHIIPNAFMRRVGAAPFMESDGQTRTKKRFSGWYDCDLLGDRGEAVTASLDGAAAACFIAGGYTYRARRDPTDPTRMRDQFVVGQIYEVKGVDTTKLRLFGLSLLWRAAQSNLNAMNLVNIRQDRMSEITARILAGDPGSPLQFPVFFSLFDGAEEMAKVAPFQPGAFPFYRFFLDGVICYVSPRRTLLSASKYGRLLVGSEPDRFPMICISSLCSNHSRLVNEDIEQIVAREGNPFGGFT